MDAVKMCGITKHFGSVHALENVDFTVAEGEIHSLLGENGAGKSTLMNVLYGMLQCDKGEIYIHGQPVTIKPNVQAAYGFFFFGIS